MNYNAGLVNGLNEMNSRSMSFNKIKVGSKTLANDVMLDIDSILNSKPTSRKPIKKEDVERAIKQNNIDDLRRISNIYYRISGIYGRLCRYMAYLYKYDWFITPLIFDDSFKKDKSKKDKLIKQWYLLSSYIENSKLKKLFGEIALKVIKDGCYYGYRIDQKNASFIQELPIQYCRSRYSLNGKPAVEFNVKYFDDAFPDLSYRTKILKMMPPEFAKAWTLWKQGKLPKDYEGDTDGWVLLDTSKAVKFNLSDNDAPLFVAIIPKLIDLADAQDLDKKKMLQQILKIIIQKMPIDKNGELVFDVEEAQDLHQNAVNMLGDAVGVDVLTTFADTEVADLADHGNVSSVDQLDKVERAVYNEAGVSQAQFNSSSNLALEKSIANDEATMSNLILQFEDYGNELVHHIINIKPGKLDYKFEILPTTVYNFEKLSKDYKDMTAIGFSKLLPQVALGRSQCAVLMSAYFENDVMNLNEVFTPPQLSSTMSGKQDDSKTSKNPKMPSQDVGGRPPKPDDEKSDKTIQNIESEG